MFAADVFDRLFNTSTLPGLKITVQNGLPFKLAANKPFLDLVLAYDEAPVNGLTFDEFFKDEPLNKDRYVGRLKSGIEHVLDSNLAINDVVRLNVNGTESEFDFEIFPSTATIEDSDLTLFHLLTIRNSSCQAGPIRNMQSLKKNYDISGHYAKWRLDPIKQIIFLEHGFDILFGHKPKEGKSVPMLDCCAKIHPEDFQWVTKSISDHLSADKKEWEASYRFKSKDGRFLAIKNIATIKRDPSNGDPLEMKGIMMPINPIEKFQLDREILEAIISNSRDGIMITQGVESPGPMIVYVNDVFLRSNGYDREELVGKTPRILQGPKSDKEELQKLKQQLLEAKPCEVLTINYTKERKEYWCHFSVSPVKGSRCDAPYFIAIQRDVTEQKKEELRQKLVADIGEAFARHITLEATLHELLGKLCQLGGCSFAEIWMVSERKNNIVRLMSNQRPSLKNSYTDNPYDAATLPFGKGLAGRAWALAKQETMDCYVTETSPYGESNIKINKVWGIPVFEGNEVFGVFVFAQDEKGLSLFPGDISSMFGYLGQIIGTEIKRKQLEIELKEVFDHIPDLICITSLDGTLIKMNPAAMTLFGLSMDKMMSMPITALVHPDDAKAMQVLLEEISRHEGTMQLENRIQSISDETRWLSWSFARSKQKGILFIGAKDITAAKTASEQLKAFNSKLEEQAKEMKEANKELEQFAYVASHDLQEPLRMVTSFLTQLEKKYGGQLDERGIQFIHFAVDGAKRMQQLIFDLLEYSRAGLKDSVWEPVDLHALVNDILLLYGKRIFEVKAEVKVSALPIVNGVRAPLRQVFQNLIGNALKYTRKDISPVIEVTVLEKDTTWLFSVSDNGIGISPSNHEKIFQIFQRLHSKSEYSGTGIGLAIVKKIIDSLGGDVWVESEKGKGSTFSFTIPKNEIIPGQQADTHYLPQTDIP